MFNPEHLLGQMLGGALGNAFGGRGRSLLRGRLDTKGALGLGLLGVAIAAYEHFSQQTALAGNAAPPPPPPAIGSATPPPLPNAALMSPSSQQDAVLLIRTMIAAAAADGRIDEVERATILAHASANDRAFLDAELAAPRSLTEIAAKARPELADSVYAAARLAIDVDTETERDWLVRLGDALGLSPAQRDAIAQRLT